MRLPSARDHHPIRWISSDRKNHAQASESEVISQPRHESVQPGNTLEFLRAQIRRIESSNCRPTAVLPFGLAEIDSRLPGGGLPLGALHEVAGGGHDALNGAAAALFVAGIAGRTKGKVLWCVTHRDLFAPALAQAGLKPDRVLFVEAQDDKTALSCCEEGLRHGGLSAVVAELARLSLTASRRLQLAAEISGAIGIALRRWRRPAEAATFGQPTAAATRWRVSVLPSLPLPVPGVGRAQWLVELLRCRAGESAEFVLEACDAEGRIALSPYLAHGSGAAKDEPNRQRSAAR